LRREELAEQEFSASIRQSGISDIATVKQAVLEADGHISVVLKDGARVAIHLARLPRSPVASTIAFCLFFGFFHADPA